METGIRILLLTAALSVLPGCATVRHWFHHGSKAEQPAPDATTADTDQTPPRVIEPQVERRTIKVPRIKSSNVELGLFYGALSIEDFGTNPDYGVTLAYHVTEDFFFQGEAGRSRGGRTSFETLSGNLNLLTDNERRFTYYDLSLGYNFLPGEAFVGRGIAMTSAFYLLGGFGATDFAGDTKFTVNFGAGYRVVPRDWLAVHFTVQDHVFQSSLLGVTKLTNNLEARLGTTVFF
ncbi:MAG TPA: outer membrane beta-barrel domain-containing protein [Steroidobacteraceae bacterium]|jgi:outer membrane beta-barrel protein|nr:outer membrane beta-barrel domain-containing protein [Steroidobacteraceae bacterium]